MSDPRQMVLQFLQGLPLRTREHALAMVAMWMHGGHGPPEQGYEEEIMHRLYDQEKTKAVGATITVVGLLDYYFEAAVRRTATAEASLKALTEEHPDDEMFAKLAPEAAEAATNARPQLDEWKAFRSAELSPAALYEFEIGHIGLGKPPPKG